MSRRSNGIARDASDDRRSQQHPPFGPGEHDGGDVHANLVGTGSRPIAYSINQPGSSMIVGGRFDRVENSARTVHYNRNKCSPSTRPRAPFSQAFDPNVDGQDLVESSATVTTSTSLASSARRRRCFFAHVAKLSPSRPRQLKPVQAEDKAHQVRRSPAPHGLLFMSGASTRLDDDPDTGAASVRRRVVPPSRSSTRRAPRSSASTSAPTAGALRSVRQLQKMIGVAQYRVAMVDTWPDVRHPRHGTSSPRTTTVAHGDNPDTVYIRHRLLAEQPVSHRLHRRVAIASATTCSA